MVRSEVRSTAMFVEKFVELFGTEERSGAAECWKGVPGLTKPDNWLKKGLDELNQKLQQLLGKNYFAQHVFLSDQQYKGDFKLLQEMGKGRKTDHFENLEIYLSKKRGKNVNEKYSDDFFKFKRNWDPMIRDWKGLMVSLILVNLTAIALFFFATPTSSEIPKKHVNQADSVPMVQTEMVMAGDAEVKIAFEDENVTAMALRDAKMEPMEEGVVPLKKTSKAGIKSPQLSLGEVQTLNPRYSLVEAQTLPGKVEMRVLDNSSNTLKKTCKVETSDRPTEPPLAIALKKFVINSSSGVRIFFEGLKNGYTIKRLCESRASNTSIRKSKGTEGVVGSTRPSLRESIASNISLKMSKVMEGDVLEGSTRPSLRGSKVNPPSNLKIGKPSHSPSQTLNLPDPTPIWGTWEDGSHQTIPTEIVMDVLSRTQKRTNELIHVFSKKVVPAIERMNDKVAEAIRLEKNLDSYTSALINAINSVVCPKADTEVDVKHKHSKPGTSAVRKLRHTKPFCSDMSLMRDSRMLDYVGTFSKGEFSSLNKRPAFKTLAARCWHTRYKRISNKANKKHSKRSDKLIVQEESGIVCQKSEQEQSGLKYDTSAGALEQTGHFFETKNNLKSNFNCMNKTPVDIPVNSSVRQGFSNLPEYPHQITIGIEEVLALTSCVEQGSDQGVQSDGDLLPFLSPLNVNSNISMSSGMASRSYVMEPPECVNIGHNLIENKFKNEKMISEPNESPESAATQSSQLPEDPADQAREQGNASWSDFSIVCGSHIQGYDSYSVQKEISAVATYSSENEETQLNVPSQTFDTDSDGIPQPGESNHSISLLGDMKNTTELVNVFQQLNRQQKEVAIENVCLLVLGIFEAWTDSQRSGSSLGLSRISLSSWPSTEQMSSQSSRPRTAICRSRIDSGYEQKSIMDYCSLPKDYGSKENEPKELTPSETKFHSGQASAEIPQNLLQNVVEAAEIQIAERSLMGLKNLLRKPPLKGNLLKGSINSADVNQSGFGDINDTITMDEELAVSLMSKSHEFIEVSKESSAATFYTGQPESSEDAFYECVSTMSAGTCGSIELEVEGSSTVFLERIQEEETKAHKNEGNVVEKPAAINEPQPVQSTFSVESWLTDSGEELRTAKDALNLEAFPVSDCSSFDIVCGTDDEAYPCRSQDLSADESEAKKDKHGQSKKKKWAAKLLRKFHKKKSKPSSFPGVALPKNNSRSQSDSVLKPNDQNLVKKDGDPTK